MKYVAVFRQSGRFFIICTQIANISVIITQLYIKASLTSNCAISYRTIGGRFVGASSFPLERSSARERNLFALSFFDSGLYFSRSRKIWEPEKSYLNNTTNFELFMQLVNQ